MPLPNHVNPDHFLALPHAVAVTKEHVRAAWERAYTELHQKLEVLGSLGTLYMVFGIQGGGKTTWVESNAPRLGPNAVFLDGPLPSRNHRARALVIAKEAGCKAVAVWVNTSFEVAWARNSIRPGLARIREEAMRHVQGQLEAPSVEEGFSQVIHVSATDTEP